MKIIDSNVQYKSVDARSILKKTLDLTVLIVGILMSTYHLLRGFVILQGNIPHLATHLTFVLVLGLLIKFRDDTRIRRYVAFGCIPIAIVLMAYILKEHYSPL